MGLLDRRSFHLDTKEAKDLWSTLTEAYSEVTDSKILISGAGMDPSGLSWTEGMKNGWFFILGEAAGQRKLRRLVEEAANDPTRAAYRERFLTFLDASQNSSASAQGARPADCDPFQLGVHRPITVVGPPVPPLTSYIERHHDGLLRDVLRQNRGVMIVMVGDPATGKTRAALEAARNHLSDWTLVHPVDAAHLIETIDARDIAPETVLWLDRLELYLGGNEEVASLLRRLLTEANATPVTIVGTASPEDLKAWTEEAPEEHVHLRALLRSAHVLTVPSTVPVSERDAWCRPDLDDPRLTLACTSAGAAGGIVQALTGMTALIERYTSPVGPSGTYEQTVITTAIDLRRLGVASPLREDLLAAAAEEYAAAKPHADWFRQGLLAALRPVHGVSPLERLPGTPHDGYVLHTSVEQYGRSSRQGAVVPPGVWDRLLQHTLPAEDALRIAREAHRRGLHRHAAHLAAPLAAEGRDAATVLLAPWLERAGFADEAGEMLAASADAGDPRVLRCYAEWLARRGESDEADGVWRRAAAAGDATARVHAAAQYAEAGDFALLKELWLEGARSGDHEARHRLIQILHEDKDEPGVERWLKIGARSGDRPALEHLVLLLDRSGRGDEADRHLRASLDGKASPVLIDRLVRAGRTDEALELACDVGGAETSLPLADALRREERITELEDYLAARAAMGNALAVLRLVALLDDTAREGEAEALLYRGMAAGDDHSLTLLVMRLDRAGRRDEADDCLRRLAESGRPAAMRMLALRATRAEVIDDWLRRAAEAGDADSLRERVQRFVRSGRTGEARSWLEHSAEQGSILAVRELLGLPGRRDECERSLRRAIECGVPNAMTDLEQLLSDTGRRTEAERLRRYGIAPGGGTSAPWTAPPQITAGRRDGEPR
ncbi:hypothetical protein [Actinomadura sp. WAC 06369]|uniref:hypothetical protein n=1 Tax=Actinomadura sp. WAC 06369 TaxID=2203193 RepID=UPI000F7AF0FC|nr:hypothetical protein [Actinomadura sp. WAC 06369]